MRKTSVVIKTIQQLWNSIARIFITFFVSSMIMQKPALSQEQPAKGNDQQPAVHETTEKKDADKMAASTGKKGITVFLSAGFHPGVFDTSSYQKNAADNYVYGSGRLIYTTDEAFNAVKPALESYSGGFAVMSDLPLDSWLSFMQSAYFIYEFDAGIFYQMSLPVDLYQKTAYLPYENKQAPHVNLTSVTYPSVIKVTEQNNSLSLMTNLYLNLKPLSQQYLGTGAFHFKVGLGFGPVWVNRQTDVSLLTSLVQVNTGTDNDYQLDSRYSQVISSDLVWGFVVSLASVYEIGERHLVQIKAGYNLYAGTADLTTLGYFRELKFTSADYETPYHQTIDTVESIKPLNSHLSIELAYGYRL